MAYRKPSANSLLGSNDHARRPRPRPQTVIGALVGGFLALVPQRAQAEGAAPRNPALAEQLFAQGKDALAKGNADAACTAFLASQAADPSVGALLNVARCHEKEGKTATAWAEYRAAATLAAHRNEEERRAGAQELANQLEPRLSRLSVEVSPQFPNVAVRVDGQGLPAVSFGIPLPMDSGEHLLEATAKGYEPWVQKIPVSGEGSRTTVLVPELKERAFGESSGRGRTIAGVVLGSLGAAALGGGAVQAVRAYSQDRALERACATPDSGGARACGVARRTDLDRLSFTANSATVLLASGGALASAGLALLFLGRSADGEPAEGPGHGMLVVPAVAPSGAGLSVSGVF